MEEVECFKCLCSLVAKRGVGETEVRCRAKDGCKALGVLKYVMRCRTMCMDANRGVDWETVVPWLNVF